MNMVPVGYYCIFSKGCWHRGVWPSDGRFWPFWHQGWGWTRCWLTADRCRRPAGTTKATETLKHPLLQDPRGTRAGEARWASTWKK